MRCLREGETAFPVADGCPTRRSGFKLVAFILLLCLMSILFLSCVGSMRGNFGASCRVYKKLCQSEQGCCSSHFGHSFLPHGAMLEFLG